MTSRRKSGAQRYGNPANRRPLAGDLAKAARPNGLADPRTIPNPGAAGPGGPRDAGAVFVSTQNAIILDHCEVLKLDAVRAGEMSGAVTFMTLGGRINKSDERAQVGFTFGPDGAAAIITQLLALADRDGAEMLDDLTRRLTELHQEKTVDLHFLRAAVDNAIANAEEMAADPTGDASATLPADPQ